MIEGIINDIMKMVIFISVGFTFGIVVGVGVGMIGLAKSFTALPSGMMFGLSLMFAVGLIMFIAIIKKENS